jgi:hypothetical protein
MAIPNFLIDRLIHLGDRPGVSRDTQAADQILQPGWRKRFGPAQQNAIGRFLNDEFGAGGPAPGLADRFGQDDLTFG